MKVNFVKLESEMTKKTKQEKVWAYKLKHKLASPAEVAKATGVSYAYTYKLLKKIGTPKEVFEAEAAKPSVTEKQVGGNHYAKHTIQPWDIIDEYGLNFYEGNALKYLLRRKGDRKEDLGKLIHYAEKLIADLEK